MYEDTEYNKNLALKAAELIAEEYERARTLFPRFYNFHEGYAILLEELDELWDEIKAKNPNKEAIKREATQVGAMAMAFIADLLLD